MGTHNKKSNIITMSSKSPTTSKGGEIKYKKAPSAPKRFKSAYMFFSERKHKELRQKEECKKMRTADVAKLVSRAWKDLDAIDRAVFLDMAKRDKERYEKEKATYKGPWKVIDVKQTAAPKKRVADLLSLGSPPAANTLLSENEVSSFLVDMFKDVSAAKGYNKPKQMYHDETGQLRLPTTCDVINQANFAMALNSVPSASTPIGFIKDESRLSFASPLNAFWVQQQQQQQQRQYQPQQDEDTAPSDMSTAVSQSSLSDAAHWISSSNSSMINEPQETLSENAGYEMDADAWLNTSNNTSSVENLTASLPSSKDTGGFINSMGQSMEPAPFALKPLISTDIGGFLAAAAILDAPFEQMFEC